MPRPLAEYLSCTAPTSLVEEGRGRREGGEEGGRGGGGRGGGEEGERGRREGMAL